MADVEARSTEYQARTNYPLGIVTDPAPEQTTSEQPLFSVGDVVLIVLAGFLVAVVAGAALAFVGDIEMDDVVLSIILLVPAQYAGQLAVLAWIVRRRKTTFTTGLRFEVRPGDLFYTLSGLALQYAIALLFFPLYELIGLEDSGQSIIDVAADTELPIAAMIVLSLAAAVLAPVVEELTFRGVLLRSLARRMSTRATIVLTSLIFAAIHILSVDITDPDWLLQFAILVPQLFLVGVPLAWLTIKHDRLGPAIFTHAGFNLWLVIFVAGSDYFTNLQ